MEKATRFRTPFMTLLTLEALLIIIVLSNVANSQ